MDVDALLGRTRAIALELPDATERLSHGSPAWFIGKSPQFASFLDRHHGVDWVAVWAACPAGARKALVEADPETYFVPPYVGARGWIGMRLDEQTDWDAVADLLDDAWTTVAKA
jgi:hypothetical protein